MSGQSPLPWSDGISQAQDLLRVAIRVRGSGTRISRRPSMSSRTKAMSARPVSSSKNQVPRVAQEKLHMGKAIQFSTSISGFRSQDMRLESKGFVDGGML